MKWLPQPGTAEMSHNTFCMKGLISILSVPTAVVPCSPLCSGGQGPVVYAQIPPTLLSTSGLLTVGLGFFPPADRGFPIQIDQFVHFLSGLGAACRSWPVPAAGVGAGSSAGRGRGIDPLACLQVMQMAPRSVLGNKGACRVAPISRSGTLDSCCLSQQQCFS